MTAKAYSPTLDRVPSTDVLARAPGSARTIRVAVFGTGSVAERAVTAIRQVAGLVIVAAADNDQRKRGVCWHGHLVSNAADLVAAGTWDYICIASQWQADIAAQLIGLGVEPAQIAVFHPWGEPGILAGVEGLQRLLPPRKETAAAIPGFEGDLGRLRVLETFGFRPRVVLDVGASNAAWSVTCASVFPGAHYYMVEPLPHYDAQRFPGTAAGWHHRPLAVGAEDGEATITIPVSQYGAFGATLLAPSRSKDAAERVRVPLRRIDTLLAEGQLAPPDLVKLDVQGAESAVLEGGQRLWDSVEVFFVELSLDRYWKDAATLTEMMALFERRGFLPFDIFNDFRNADGRLIQIDCVFLRRDGPVARTNSIWRDLHA